MRLAKGSKLTVDCGGARMVLPLKNVKSMKINPKRISSIGGRLHFGVELLLRDSTTIGGGEGGGRCYTPADNGIAAKTSKGKFSLPFEKLRYVYILGKEDAEEKQPPNKDGAAEKTPEVTEPPNGEANETEQSETNRTEKEDDGESAREKE